jgi:hypothetical protein
MLQGIKAGDHFPVGYVVIQPAFFKGGANWPDSFFMFLAFMIWKYYLIGTLMAYLPKHIYQLF